jgi:ABC-type antimicrobial peptide transport system permease subunit
MSGGFGLLALCLAFVGLYGVMSYTVARRTREIGIRIALGATSALILGRMLRETLAVSGIGIILGLAATAATTKILSAFLFGLSPRDPTTLGLVTMILMAIAVIAGYVPARRAAGIDPMRTLKAE